MRKCSRCETEMVEDLTYRLELGRYNSGWIAAEGIIRKNLGEPSVAVCPKCGYIEFYLDDLSEIEDYAKKHKDEEND